MRIDRRRIGWLVAATCLVLVGLFVMPAQRRAFIQSIITWDAEITDPVDLPAASGAGLAPTPRTRVILIDGLSASTAATLPGWNAVCDRGIRTTVDVGFPTVSLPIEVALWSGLTQQQTGVVFRSDRPLDRPLAGSIPPRVAGSIAIAENHGYIVRSLGFSHVEPAAGDTAARDADPDGWKTSWLAHARDAVSSPSPLAFVHVLRVDTAGHKKGGASPEYAASAREADAILGELVALDPDARWFALSDHGHVSQGGHGGEERFLRHVTACIAGPGIAKHAGGLIHLVDLSRALADSVGVPLVPTSEARPLDGALAHPLDDDLAVPGQRTGRVLGAIMILVAGGAGTVLLARRRRWFLIPWWLPIAIASFVIVRGVPTLSTPMIYPPSGRDMWLAWQPALGIAAIATWLGIRRGGTLVEVLVGSVALPFALWAAAITACGAWPAIFGAEDGAVPIVPHVTAWCSPLALIAGQSAIAIGVALVASVPFRQRGA